MSIVIDHSLLSVPEFKRDPDILANIFGSAGPWPGLSPAFHFPSRCPEELVYRISSLAEELPGRPESSLRQCLAINNLRRELIHAMQRHLDPPLNVFSAPASGLSDISLWRLATRDFRLGDRRPQAKSSTLPQSDIATPRSGNLYESWIEETTEVSEEDLEVGHLTVTSQNHLPTDDPETPSKKRVLSNEVLWQTPPSSPFVAFSPRTSSPSPTPFFDSRDAYHASKRRKRAYSERSSSHDSSEESYYPPSSASSRSRGSNQSRLSARPDHDLQTPDQEDWVSPMDGLLEEADDLDEALARIEQYVDGCDDDEEGLLDPRIRNVRDRIGQISVRLALLGSRFQPSQACSRSSSSSMRQWVFDLMDGEPSIVDRPSVLPMLATETRTNSSAWVLEWDQLHSCRPVDECELGPDGYADSILPSMDLQYDCCTCDFCSLVPVDELLAAIQGDSPVWRADDDERGVFDIAGAFE